MQPKRNKVREAIVKEILIRKELDNGPHPEKHSSRYFRKRSRRFRNERLRPSKPRSVSAFVEANVRQPRNNRSIWRKESVTPMERLADEQLFDAISQIFQHNRMLEEMEQKAPTTIEFMRQGWKLPFAPSGMRIPVTPKCIIVPLGYFTRKENRIRAKKKARAKPKPKIPIFSTEMRRKIRNFLTYWFKHYARYNQRQYPIHFARLSDLDETERIDLTKKNYQYFPNRGSAQLTKRKVPILYDGCMQCIFGKYTNLRKYNKHFITKYRYKPTYELDVRDFKLWESPKDIEAIRKVFLKYDRQLTGFVSFQDMCAILDTLGNKTSVGLRQQEFDWFTNLGLKSKLTPPGESIEFEEFLRAYYILEFKQVGPNRGYPKERRLTPPKPTKWMPAAERNKFKPSVLHDFPNSFRNGNQCPSIISTHSVYWKLSTGLF